MLWRIKKDERKKEGRKEGRKESRKGRMGEKITYVDSLKGFSHFKVSASLKCFPHPFSAVFSVQGSWSQQISFQICMSISFWKDLINRECWQHWDGRSRSFLLLLMPGSLTTHFHYVHHQSPAFISCSAWCSTVDSRPWVIALGVFQRTRRKFWFNVFISMVTKFIRNLRLKIKSILR